MKPPPFFVELGPCPGCGLERRLIKELRAGPDGITREIEYFWPHQDCSGEDGTQTVDRERPR